MSTSLVALMLSLPTTGYPAPKDSRSGLPADVLDLVPADTAAMLLIDIPRVAKSPIGKYFVKQLSQYVGESFITVEDIVHDVELAVVAQFDIDKFAGDFCIILRLKEKSSLIDKVFQTVSQDEPLGRYDGRTVHKFDNPPIYFSAIDRKTLVAVLLTNNPTGDELKASLQSAFAQPNSKTPNEALRKKLNEIPFDDAVAVVSEHEKSGSSLGLAIAPIGGGGAMDLFKSSVKSYRGGIGVGRTADILMEIVATNADAAKDVVSSLRSYFGHGSEPRSKPLDLPVRISQDKDRVTVRLSADEQAIRTLFRGE